jgi:hypothetical protein
LGQCNGFREKRQFEGRRKKEKGERKMVLENRVLVCFLGVVWCEIGALLLFFGSEFREAKGENPHKPPHGYLFGALPRAFWVQDGAVLAEN